SLIMRPPQRPTPFPYTTLFRSANATAELRGRATTADCRGRARTNACRSGAAEPADGNVDEKGSSGEKYGSSSKPNTAHRAEKFQDRKSTRLNSSHQIISYAVFC